MHILLDQITKTFGKVRANDAISMEFQEGRLYAVLGENGAGKSTLMKILSGFQAPDSGLLRIDQHICHFKTPADALRAGVGMLHQDPLDVPPFTVLDNFLLARPTGLIPQRAAAEKLFHTTAFKLGFTLDPHAFVDTLTIGERQQVEITRLISLGAKTLILDEPTTGISGEQKESLFSALRTLARDQKMTVILVSHKLEDVEVLCDFIYVLRAGKLVGSAPMPISTAQMVEMMFGKRLDPEPRSSSTSIPANVLLQIDGARVREQTMISQSIYLKVRRGEVIGFAGLDGSGQRALLRACVGLDQLESGRIMIEGEDVSGKSYHDRRVRGIAFASAGRLEEGLVRGLTLTEHVALAEPRPKSQTNLNQAALQAAERILGFNVRGKPDSRIETLSGGNQQRVALSLLPPNLKLLLLENPTRGLDVESARSVWQKLLMRRDAENTAILFTSPELDEIIQYSDRIMVFAGGKSTLIESPESLSAAQLGQMIGGKTVQMPETLPIRRNLRPLP
jgi:simple sugar transport system ATP-binding protein